MGGLEIRSLSASRERYYSTMISEDGDIDLWVHIEICIAWASRAA